MPEYKALNPAIAQKKATTVNAADNPVASVANVDTHRGPNVDTHRNLSLSTLVVGFHL